MDGKEGEKRRYKSNKKKVPFKEALRFMKNTWKLQKKSVIALEKDEPMEISVLLTSRWVTIKKPLSIMKKIWKLQKKSVIGPKKE